MALGDSAGVREISARIAISLLRHTDVLPADRAFYEAGNQAKVISLCALYSLTPFLLPY